MAAPKASVLDVSGKKSKDVSLDESVYAVEVKPHLVHEAVRSELNPQRPGTAPTKSRGLDSRRAPAGRARERSAHRSSRAAVMPSPRCRARSSRR